MQIHLRVTGVLVCFSLLLGWSGTAWSGPGPKVDLPGLCNASRVVMVGTTRLTAQSTAVQVDGRALSPAVVNRKVSTPPPADLKIEWP